MNWWVVVAVAALVLLGFVAFKLGWIDLSNKTKQRNGGSSSSLVGIGDEVFAPTRYEAQIEMDRQTLLPAPAPLAGDDDKGVFDGKITINVAGGTATARPGSPRSAGRHVSATEDPDTRDAS